MDLVWREMSHLHHHHCRFYKQISNDLYVNICFSYEFSDSLCCCFSDVVLPISCLSFPCSVANDCNSLLNVCNE